MKIRFNKKAEFWKIPREKLLDIIPLIKLPGEGWILKKWEDYFTGVGVPYCAIEKRGLNSNGHKIRMAQIWVERRAMARPGEKQRPFPFFDVYECEVNKT